MWGCCIKYLISVLVSLMICKLSYLWEITGLCPVKVDCGYNFLQSLWTSLGDLGGSTEHDEDGGDKDTNHGDGLPNSPTSSGGFRRFSSKGLCRKELSAQHCFGGNMELYVQDLLCCLPQEIVFRL